MGKSFLRGHPTDTNDPTDPNDPTPWNMNKAGGAGIPVSRDSREYKPQISRPFPSHGIFNFPFPFPGKGSFGRELGREILSSFSVLNIF